MLTSVTRRRGWPAPHRDDGVWWYLADEEDKTMRNDAEMQRAGIAELSWDPHVEGTEVGVAVDRGVVTITGTVSSYAKRLAAQQAAHRVFGVHDVANDIVVK